MAAKKFLILLLEESFMSTTQKDITIFKSTSPAAPLVILNTVQNEGKQVYDAAVSMTDMDFSLAAIENIDWNREMTPWPAQAVMRREEDFAGEADAYLQELTGIILPDILAKIPAKPEYIALAGYSLGGLFAVYALYRTDLFARAASASGSFWYPDFLDFVRGHKLCRKPERLYFSLGNKEAKTKNPVMKTVEEKTKELHRWYKEQGIPVIYEENPGNHFQDAVNRMAKGIAWILQ